MKSIALALTLFITLFSANAQETVTASHRGSFDGASMNYTSKTGTMIINGEDSTEQMQIFYIAYTKDGISDAAQRPITFVFNGGPGSSSVWLHMGGLGPKRILMAENGGPLAPPYSVVENEYSWLGKTDLVFIDPAMTGFSRATNGSDKQNFVGYENDIRTVGDFIYRYTSENDRWKSPKFIAGESYGTTRASGLSGYLQNRHGMFVNGLMLISSVLNFQTIRNPIGNDTPYPLILPTMAATAWYHKKLDAGYDDLRSLLDEVERFASTEYLLALQQGDALTPERKAEILKKLSQYTGLSENYLDNVNMRPYTGRFNKELLRSEKKTVGRLDSRFTGVDYDAGGSTWEFSGDPSYSKVIYGPFTMAVNDHIRRTLKYKSDLPYDILNGRNVRPWKYPENRYLNVAETLRGAMTNNPYMKVWIANGYYDMATPYFATEYTLDHMFLSADLKPNISMTYYEAGHMMYIDMTSLKQFKKDFDAFMADALGK